MNGASGTYAINGTDFLMQPTKAKWKQRKDVGMDGNGHTIYTAVRDFEISWNLMHPTDWAQIISAYQTVQNTGTITFDLPEYNNPNLFEFQSYSGCIISEPEQGEYFQGWVSDVSILVYNVRT